MYRKVKSPKETEMYKLPKPTKPQRAVTSLLSTQERTILGFLLKCPKIEAVIWFCLFFFPIFEIVTQLQHLFLPLLPSKPSHIPLLTLLQTCGLHCTNCNCMHISIYTYLSRSITCLVCVMLPGCVYSGLTAWHWATSW